jgi:hypothetical protein
VRKIFSILVDVSVKWKQTTTASGKWFAKITTELDDLRAKAGLSPFEVALLLDQQATYGFKRVSLNKFGFFTSTTY